MIEVDGEESGGGGSSDSGVNGGDEAPIGRAPAPRRSPPTQAQPPQHPGDEAVIPPQPEPLAPPSGSATQLTPNEGGSLPSSSSSSSSSPPPSTPREGQPSRNSSFASISRSSSYASVPSAPSSATSNSWTGIPSAGGLYHQVIDLLQGLLYLQVLL